MTIDDAFVRDDPADLDTLAEARHTAARPLATRFANQPPERDWLRPLLNADALADHPPEMTSLLRRARLDDEVLG